MFKNILVPVDFTERNENALRIACELGAAEARLHLLHVIEQIEHLPPGGTLTAFYRKLEKAAQKKLEELGGALTGEVTLEAQAIVYGRRAEEIVKYAVGQANDLIVMSSHRLDASDPARTWATVSHQVAILSQCPVLLVK